MLEAVRARRADAGAGECSLAAHGRAQRQPVINGVLGTVDTTFLPDGLYAMRVAATVSDDGRPIDPEYTVNPVRVSNINSPLSPAPSETPAIRRMCRPRRRHRQPPPAPAVPYVVTRRRAMAPSTCAPLRPGGQQRLSGGGRAGAGLAPISGLSSDGSGWYLVTTPAGLQGWVSPAVVNAIGDLSTVASVAPPAPCRRPAANHRGPVAPTGMSINRFGRLPATLHH